MHFYPAQSAQLRHADAPDSVRQRIAQCSVKLLFCVYRAEQTETEEIRMKPHFDTLFSDVSAPEISIRIETETTGGSTLQVQGLLRPIVRGLFTLLLLIPMLLAVAALFFFDTGASRAAVAGLMLLFDLFVFFPAHLVFSYQFSKFLRDFQSVIQAK